MPHVLMRRSLGLDMQCLKFVSSQKHRGLGVMVHVPLGDAFWTARDGTCLLDDLELFELRIPSKQFRRDGQRGDSRMVCNLESRFSAVTALVKCRVSSRTVSNMSLAKVCTFNLRSIPS